VPDETFEVVEICAGAGGQAIGLERAGFEHALAVELDRNASATLKANRDWKVATGDVADRGVWNPAVYDGIDLVAGGVPCPPFSDAGQQKGAEDERDLFAWAVELAGQIKPRALLLENVRGLSKPRFAGYRQHVLDRLHDFGYVAEWKLLQASDYGVPQLRPRFVLVAMRPDDFAWFNWPEPTPTTHTVGSYVVDLMASNGWSGAHDWADAANGIAPTIVGGSKKHGGADLGPTRAKREWAALGVDGKGIADRAPGPEGPLTPSRMPRLTLPMVARLQGWRDDWNWRFEGGKTSTYRQIGNAFPPPVAEAVGSSIVRAFSRTGEQRSAESLRTAITHDEVLRVLRDRDGWITRRQLINELGEGFARQDLDKRLANIGKDFDLEVKEYKTGPRYRLGEFRAFVGQESHQRNIYLREQQSKVS
jgi:DNA (cytosine-5)-methyltransferase 1